MTTPPTFDQALSELRSTLQADGGDITLIVNADHEVRLSLVIADANCAECVTPSAILEKVALQALRRADPSIQRVTIEDPPLVAPTKRIEHQ